MILTGENRGKQRDPCACFNHKIDIECTRIEHKPSGPWQASDCNPKPRHVKSYLQTRITKGTELH